MYEVIIRTKGRQREAFYFYYETKARQFADAHENATISVDVAKTAQGVITRKVIFKKGR